MCIERYWRLYKYDHRTGKLFLAGTANGFRHAKLTCSSWCENQPPKTYFYNLKVEQEEFFSCKPFKRWFAVPLPAVKKYFWRKWMNFGGYALWIWEILIRNGLFFLLFSIVSDADGDQKGGSTEQEEMN